MDGGQLGGFQLGDYGRGVELALSETVSEPTSRPEWTQDNPEYSLWSTLKLLLLHWKIGFAALTLALIAGAAAYLLVPRIYEATALLAPAKDVASGGALGGLAGRIGGIASLAGVELPDQQTEVDVALALLQSQGFLQAFLVEEKALPILYPEEYAVAASAQAGAVEDRPTLQQGFTDFRDEVLEVSRDRQAGLVEVRIRWTDPQVAVAWCDSLVKRLNAQMRQGAAIEAERSIEFLNRELQKTPVLEIRQSIYQLLESQVNQLMIANVREDFVFRVIDPPHQSDLDKFVSPSLVVVVSVSVLLGCLLAVFTMAGAHMLGRRTRGVDSGQ